MLKLISPQKDDTVLDVACGDGIVAFEFASLVKKVTGIDLTPDMIKRAEIIQKEKDLDNIEWKIGDVSILPFQDNEFSIVVTRYSLHHMINPHKVLGEMYRVCKPGGRIMVVDITPEKDKKESYNMVEKLRDPSHTEALTPEELKEMMHDLGIVNIQVEHFDLELDLERRLQSTHSKSVNMEKIIHLFKQDLTNDNLGLRSHLVNSQIQVFIPISVIVGFKGKQDEQDI